MVGSEHYPEEFPSHSTGIKVIIVGLGLGGLAAAIECHRKGHTVVCFEQMPELKPIGDSIAIGANAASIVRKWGGGSVDRTLQPLLAQSDKMDICDSSGVLLVASNMAGYGNGEGYPAHRGDFAKTFYDHAKDLGIEIHFGARVTEYWETDTEAGIIVDGIKYSSDCVIGADGVHSKARRPVTGEDGKPHASGYAMYRAWFDSKKVREDPKNDWLFEGASSGKDNTRLFIGTDIHVMIGTAKTGDEVFWMCTHKDEFDIGESWSFPGKIDEALGYIQDWLSLPAIENIVKHTPSNRLIDYKLLWRDPLSTWVSSKGRMMLIGDAAHPFLPTSGQGAGQSIEDAATIAIALQLAGSKNIPLALMATEKMRYDRVSIIQKMGVETRDAWHKIDWAHFRLEGMAGNLELPRPAWIFGHDSQAYAYSEFDKAAESLLNGTTYVPKNIPPKGKDHRTNDFMK